MILQVASAENFGSTMRSTPDSVPAAAMAVGSTADSSAPAPAVLPSVQFSTDMRVDDQHQVYYEFVDKSTGDVVFEIPPEALREIGESLNLSMVGDASVHSFDVKS
jgi:hypothetical protein